MKGILTERTLNHNLQNCRTTLLPNPKTIKYSTNTVADKAGQGVRWSTLPRSHKSLSSSDLFKFEIKTWHCNDCN